MAMVVGVTVNTGRGLTVIVRVALLRQPELLDPVTV